MKPLILFCFTILTLSAIAQFNVYHPFPDSNAVWNFHYQMYCFANGTGNENYSITISGDTIINKQRYHKLNSPYVQSFSTGTCGGNTKGYKGAIRNDTTVKKVFYISPTDTIEQLLYDFTLQVGDTVKGFIETFASPSDTVQSIDSILVGNSYRKRWNINKCYNISIIEGIGSTYGLFEKSPGCITDAPDFSLVCFQQNGNPLYPNTTTNCQLITGLNSIVKPSTEFTIFPNPSMGSFTINFDSGSIKEIKLFDILGNLVFHERNNNKKRIKIDKLNSGIYILFVTDENNNSSSKKIINKP